MAGVDGLRNLRLGEFSLISKLWTKFGIKLTAEEDNYSEISILLISLLICMEEFWEKNVYRLRNLLRLGKFSIISKLWSPQCGLNLAQN